MRYYEILYIVHPALEGGHLQDIIKSVDSDDNVYEFPADMIALEHVSIKDTSDSKYKRIRRTAYSPIVTEDTDPE